MSRAHLTNLRTLLSEGPTLESRVAQLRFLLEDDQKRQEAAASKLDKFIHKTLAPLLSKAALSAVYATQAPYPELEKATKAAQVWTRRLLSFSPLLTTKIDTVALFLWNLEDEARKGMGTVTTPESLVAGWASILKLWLSIYSEINADEGELRDSAVNKVLVKAYELDQVLRGVAKAAQGVEELKYLQADMVALADRLENELRDLGRDPGKHLRLKAEDDNRRQALRGALMSGLKKASQLSDSLARLLPGVKNLKGFPKDVKLAGTLARIVSEYEYGLADWQRIVQSLDLASVVD